MSEFKRKTLKKIFEDAGVDVPNDVIGQICELHTDSTDELVESLKETEKKLKATEQERDDAKAKAPKEGEEVVSKAEYDKLNNYVEDAKKEKTHAAKVHAFREILKAASISEKYHDKIVRVSEDDIEAMELDDKGEVKNKDDLVKKVKEENDIFVVTKREKGAEPPNPPEGSPDKKTKEQIIAIKDRDERQAEIAKNIELFD